MNAFEIAATVLMLGLVPLGAVAALRRPIDGLVALELAGSVTTLVLVCFGEAFHRGIYETVAVIAALLSWVGGLVFARFLGRLL